MELRVHGCVQGVCFRDSTRQKAEELGVVGFVRNVPDGSVFLHAEGKLEALQQLHEWCEQGPRFAVVDRVDRTDCEPRGERGFRVAY